MLIGEMNKQVVIEPHNGANYSMDIATMCLNLIKHTEGKNGDTIYTAKFHLYEIIGKEAL